MPESGYNVIGYVTANLGLGAAARNTLARLLDRGADVRATDIDPGAGRSGTDTTYARLVATTPPERPAAINIFHLNPPEVLSAWPQWRSDVDIEHGFNVCVPFWELPHLPPSWVPAIASMDAILAPTRFVMEACLAAVPDATVIHYPQAVSMPGDVAAARERWGVPHDVTAFFVAFDINSDIERKNPWGALDAFSCAFPGGEAVRLVVRVNALGATGQMRGQIESLRARARVDERIMLIEGQLSYRDVLCLYASCDVLVSLHRSEGLGLPLMEAMSLGKPVVATGWSGNMDFMDEASACLVPYSLVPVAAALPSYAPDVIGPGQVWAEPDIEAAAEWLRLLARDPGARERLGAMARAGIESHRRYALEGDPFVANAEAWTASLGMNTDCPRASRLRKLVRQAQREQRTANGKRAVVLALRRLGLYPKGY